MIKNKEIKIEAKNISKSFEINIRKTDTALAGFISIFKKKTEKKKIEVIKELSFIGYANETIGIIGKNGSGKSTLLRILADIYKPDSGKVYTNGRVVYLSGFGQGLNSKLTMRENIFLMSSVLGLSQKDIKKRYSEIVEFSELKDFTETPVFKFSNGMIIRLVFSVVIHCLEHNYPEIMLFDEVLDAGGDIGFQEKAKKKILELIKGGATVILVSHNLDNILRYCDRVFWVNNGKIVMAGNTKDVIDKYKETFN